MADTIIGPSISGVQIGNEVYPIDAVTFGEKTASDFQENKLVTTLAGADDEHYPSARCVWTELSNIETRLRNI